MIRRPLTRRPTPRTMTEAFPHATRESLYSFVEREPERHLVGPAMTIIAVVLLILILTGVIVL